MKKTQLKLDIQKSTLRELSSAETGKVMGGGTSNCPGHIALSTGKQGASGVC